MAMRGSRGSASVGCAAWVALLLAAAALLLAWSAYRRTGGRLQDLLHGGGAAPVVVGQPPGPAHDALWRGKREVEQRAALTEAEARLLARRTEVEANRDYALARQEVDSVRRDLARAFGDAEAAARARWQAVDDELQRLDAQLREGSSRAVATLDGAVARIRGALGGGGDGAQR